MDSQTGRWHEQHQCALAQSRHQTEVNDLGLMARFGKLAKHLEQVVETGAIVE